MFAKNLKSLHLSDADSDAFIHASCAGLEPIFRKIDGVVFFTHPINHNSFNSDPN